MKSVQARHYHRGRTGKVRVVVVHDMEWPETATTAEDCARMFATMTRPASAHVCEDSNSAVRCVADADTAWAAPGCNHDGLQLEMAGFARQTREQWLDTYSLAMLGQAARVVAGWCKKYDIPIKHLSVAELKAGKKGIVGHVDVSKAYRRTDHHDPGPNFPWDHFLDLVRLHANGGTPKPAPKPVNPTEVAVKKLPTLKLGDGKKDKDPLKWDVKTLHYLLLARDYGGLEGLDDTVFTKQHEAGVKGIQAAAGLKQDGICGPLTWAVLLRVA